MIGQMKQDKERNQRAREAKASKEAQIAQRLGNVQQRTQNYANNFTPGFSLSGSLDELEQAQSGLELAGTGYGQNLFDIGKDIQRVKELQRSRTEGTDAISQRMKNEKAGNLAMLQRQMAQSGVRGPAGARALDEVARKKDADIAASLYGQQAQNIAQERTLASNMLAGTTALMQGSRAQGTAANMPKAPEASGFLGTVICTELYNQGYYSKELYEKDVEYGKWIRANKPEVYVGYRMWADYVVALMKKSELFTAIVATFAVPWAKNMAGQENKLGKFVSSVGEPICFVLGKIKSKVKGVKYAI